MTFPPQANLGAAPDQFRVPEPFNRQDPIDRLRSTIPQLGAAGLTGATEAFIESIAESLDRLATDGLNLSNLATIVAAAVNNFTVNLSVNLVQFAEDEFTAGAGQTAFALSQPFVASSLSIITINGVGYAEGTDYTISGTSLTWLDTDFALAAGDEVIAKYMHSGVAAFQEDEFTATAAQTVFALTKSFKAGGLSILYINGVGYAEGTDYTISGTTLTWLDTDFVLAVGDEIIIKYEHV